MANILFTHSYFLRFDPKQWKMQQPYPPLGTIYAASCLRNEGYQVELFDTMFVSNSSELQPVLENFHPDYLVIYDDGFNYLTKMCLTNMRNAAMEMIHIAKRHGCKVIVCSSDSSDHYAKYLSEGTDYVIIGEGEQTLIELINGIESKLNDFNQIAGLAYLKDGRLVFTSKRNVLRELDAIPFPAWDLVDIQEYRSRWIKRNGYFSLNLVSTRGCPYKCNWCAKPIYGNRYNSRSPQNVVDELKFLLNEFKPDHIWFCDDIFGITEDWVQEFANVLESEGLAFKFKIQSRVDLLVKGNTVEALSRAGCEEVWVGAESGSQHILDAMDKGTKVEQIYEATHLLKKYGIKSAFFLQFGYLGERMQDIQMTLKMVLDLMPDYIGISVSYPLPGTKFYEKVKTDLKDKTNWTDSDDLSMMFHNTYSSKFYKILHRYVHKAYRKKQSRIYLKEMFTTPSSFNKEKIKRASLLGYYTIATFIAEKRLKMLQDE